MSRQDYCGPTREERSSKKWSVVRSRTVPASATLTQINSSAGTPRAGESGQHRVPDAVPAGVHKSPGYFEETDSQLIKK